MCLDTHKRPSAASALDDEVLFLFTFFLSFLSFFTLRPLFTFLSTPYNCRMR
ncbi:hypothetical protein BDV30DRAFT_4372 [Aspergillus minisclerotigenes]|uniref:Uncharacterized protein n=1 Tax=Aspergillus minisclerotigenes TaxID=656917 RepID=A0A5N6JLW8_9EURO|nr:hypothetical protein BDV30DRAFT_4372 [Aspergillus minisclerotigenes]